MKVFPIILALALCGCSQQTLQSAQNDAQHNVHAVQKEAGPQLKKLDLGARVTAAITASTGLKHTSIRVDAGEGGVTLRGTVSVSAQKELAARIARDTLGPGPSVKNELRVKG